MSTFYVIWTYLGNYSGVIEVEASNAEGAKYATTGYFGEEFQLKATVYVFDRKPVLVKEPHIVRIGTAEEDESFRYATGKPNLGKGENVTYNRNEAWAFATKEDAEREAKTYTSGEAIPKRVR